MCRAMLLAGDFFLGAIVAAAMTKLVLRLRALHTPAADLNARTAQVPLPGPSPCLLPLVLTTPCSDV